MIDLFPSLLPLPFDAAPPSAFSPPAPLVDATSTASHAALAERAERALKAKPFCGHVPACCDADQHVRKLTASRVGRVDRRRQKRQREQPPPTSTRLCGGCHKQVRGHNFMAGGTVDDSWKCSRCLRAHERTRCFDCGDELPAWRFKRLRRGLRCLPCFGAVLDARRAMQGQCEGTTVSGRRCRVTRASRNADAEPLRQGGGLCAHHMAYDEPPITCAATTVRGAPCKVHSRLSYKEAAPLRCGSLFCHHHRVQCEGWVRDGARCTVSSSSEHDHAEPLRRGERFCTHHTSQAGAKRCDACWQVIPVDGRGGRADSAATSPVKPWYCLPCWESWEASEGSVAAQVCPSAHTICAECEVCEDEQQSWQTCSSTVTASSWCRLRERLYFPQRAIHQLCWDRTPTPMSMGWPWLRVSLHVLTLAGSFGA